MNYEKIKKFNLSKVVLNIYSDIAKRFDKDIAGNICFLGFDVLTNLMPKEVDYIMSVPIIIRKKQDTIRINYRVTTQGEILSCVKVPISLFEEGDDEK